MSAAAVSLQPQLIQDGCRVESVEMRRVLFRDVLLGSILFVSGLELGHFGYIPLILIGDNSTTCETPNRDNHSEGWVWLNRNHIFLCDLYTR